MIRSARQLARRLLPCGLHTGMLLLGVGLLSELIDDIDAADVYAQIAASPDPLQLVGDYYRYAANEPYGWLTDALTGLTSHLAAADVVAEEALQRAANALLDVDIAESAIYAGGELLGPVRVELDDLIVGERRALQYLTLDVALVQALIDAIGIVKEGKDDYGMLDGWCGSGVRVIALAVALDSLGHDAAKSTWHLRDPDPVNIAVAAINMRAAQLPLCSFEIAPGIFHGDGYQGTRTIDQALADGAYTSESMTERSFVEAYADFQLVEAVYEQLEEQQAVTSIVRQALEEGADLS